MSATPSTGTSSGPYPLRQRGRCSRFSPVCGARRPHSPESGDKVRRQSICHLGSSDVEQSANDSQKFQHLVKLQICFEVSLVYLTILEAAPTVSICDGALESVLRVMAPQKLSSYYYYYYSGNVRLWHLILLYGAQPCDAGGVIVVSSSPLEGELTGSSWHLCYGLYALCAQKGSDNVTGLLQWVVWVVPLAYGPPCFEQTGALVSINSCHAASIMLGYHRIAVNWTSQSGHPILQPAQD